MTTTTTPEALILQTDASGAPVRLEYVRGRLKVEASPASRHQKTAKVIEASLRPISGLSDGCTCSSLQDVLIRFPDGSLKRPDIAIFCAPPPTVDEALDVLPRAVVEILSVGYEEKDLGDDGAPFYLSFDIEVLVVDPRKRRVSHFCPGQPPTRHMVPISIDLLCGCRVTL